MFTPGLQKFIYISISFVSLPQNTFICKITDHEQSLMLKNIAAEKSTIIDHIILPAIRLRVVNSIFKFTRYYNVLLKYQKSKITKESKYA
jgi:hypothetical protein